jgi:hypothetical protein
LIKWEGYLDLDNMWVDKDDVSADDKVREFKVPNPKAEVHLRPHIITIPVTDLQGPPLECTQTEKLRDLKKLAQHYARDQGSCDDTRISYLEILEDRNDNNLRLAQKISG